MLDEKIYGAFQLNVIHCWKSNSQNSFIFCWSKVFNKTKLFWKFQLLCVYRSDFMTLWSFQKRDFVIFWKVSEFCSHFHYALSQRWTPVGLWNYTGWVSVKIRWGKTKSKNIIMVTWPFRGFQKSKKISMRNTFTKYTTQISMLKLQAKSPSLYVYENRPRKLHRQWILVNFYFSILICYLLKSDHGVMVPILSHRNPHVGPFLFQNFLVQKL